MRESILGKAVIILMNRFHHSGELRSKQFTRPYLRLVLAGCASAQRVTEPALGRDKPFHYSGLRSDTWRFTNQVRWATF